MRTFRPPQVPESPAQLPGFLRVVLAAIQQAANRADPVMDLEYLHAEPEKVFAGRIVLADGTDWNPDGVSGAGMYRRNEANNAWVFIG